MENKENEVIQGKNNKSKILIIILSVSLLCVFCLLLLVFLDKGKDNNSNEPKGEQKDNVVVRSTLYQVDCGKNENVEYNGHSFQMVTHVEESNVGCKIDSIKVDGKDLTTKLSGDSVAYDIIDTYEFIDDYIVYSASNGSAPFFVIYNIKEDIVKVYDPKDFEGFAFVDWEAFDSYISFTKCSNGKEQFLDEGVTFNHNSSYADFRIDYKDGKFSNPIFVKEYDE